MHEVFLGHLHQEISIKSDIKLETSRGLLCRSNMQVECSIQQSNGLIGITTFSPLYQRLKIDKLSIFRGVAAGIVRFVDFIDKLKLLLSVVVLILSDSTINHAYQWSHVLLI